MRQLLAYFIIFVHLPLMGEAYIPKYLWNLGFAIGADQTPFPNGLPKGYGSVSHKDFVDPKRYIYDVKNGDIIWVQRAQLSRFVKKSLPRIKSPFVLVISDGDLSFPSCRYDPFDVKYLLNHPNVVRIFAQNVDGTLPHPKIRHLPIGLDFHSMAKADGFFGESYHSIREQEAILTEILQTLQPTHMRRKRVLLDFGHNDFNGYGESRTDVIAALSSRPFVDRVDSLPRHMLWQLKGEYAFAVSPHGYGLDCHRTWEGLVLGNIVIVKTSSLDPLYEGLPIVIVKDWAEINEKNLDRWLEKYQDAFTNPSYREKLTHAYWMQKIRRATGRFH